MKSGIERPVIDRRPSLRRLREPGYSSKKDSGLYDEQTFLEMLRLERKRTERCRRPFLLMLLDLSGFTDISERREIARKTVCRLCPLTRETDIKGWYKHDSVFGVIFIEINDIDPEFLKRKVYGDLGAVLLAEELKKIVITTYVFPEPAGKQGEDNSADLALYPDSSRRSSRKGRFIIKRVVDVIGSIFGLIIFSPLFLLIALCIKLTSEGPVFFRQERIGRYRKKFIFLKFRTMYINNNPNIHREFVTDFICGKDCRTTGGEGRERVYKIKDDPRITPVGKFLRKTSLDELPQFYNVLKGDMSLVGPRPPIHYEYERFDIWHRQRVMEVKPGITGLWQVRGRSSTTFDDMVRLDIKYIREWSLWLDIKIMLQTPLVVVMGKGAY
jgi:lipopolysaccharide/colanic/teichoic acid biosynthesis glycosyltransferase